MKYLITVIALLTLSCGGQKDFKSASSKKAPASTALEDFPENPEEDEKPIEKPTETIDQEYESNLGSNNDSPDSEPPENTVTKGSFSVYTAPKNPRTFEDYDIHIIVSLPKELTVNYDKEDLSGSILGTDDFRYLIGDEDKRYSDLEHFQLDASSNRATLIIPIPGAEFNVKDTINIRSKILNESQEVTLYFGNIINP